MPIFDKNDKYEIPKLRLEDELLLFCARTNVNPEIRDKILSLIENNLDWDYLLKLASRHRLMPLLYYNLNSTCPELVPEGILSELKEYFNANVRKNLMMTGELIKVLNLLEAEGIKAVPYKGPVLASMVHGNIGLREFGDLDVFVPRSDVLKAKNLLLSENYNLCLEFEHITDKFYLKTQREYALFNNNNGIVTEIHWDFHGPFFYLPLESDFFCDDLKIVNINDFKVSSFTPENLFIILCIHNAKHDWENLGWICDIHELIQNYKLNWTSIIEKTTKLGTQRIVFINLFLAKHLLGLNIPEKLLHDLDSDLQVKKMSISIINRLFSKTEHPFNLINKTFFDFKKRENIYYGFKDCVFGLTTPTYPDFEILTLPNLLYPLYYVFRPFNLLKRYKI